MKIPRNLFVVAALAVLGVFLAFQTGQARLTGGTTSDNDAGCWGVSGAEFCVDSSGNPIPTTDNDTTLGTSSLRFATVYTLDQTVSDDLTVSGDATVALTLGVGDLTPDAQFEVQSLGAGETYALLISSDNGSTNEVAFDTANDELEISAKVSIGQTIDTTPDATVEIVPAIGDTYSLIVSSVGAAVSHLAVNSSQGGHLEVAGAAPAVSACGTSPSILGSDVAGKVTIGSSASGVDGCVLTFAVPYTNAPACVTQGEDSAIVYANTTTTTALTMTSTAAGDNSSDVFSYICFGRDAD